LCEQLDSTFVVIAEVETGNWGWGGLPEHRRRRAGTRAMS
jgi:4-oxalocrotonate tautomerase